MREEEMIRTYVRSQYRLEGDTTPPGWLVGDKRKWWLDEAKKINQEQGIAA